MKKYLMVLIGLIVLFNACSKNETAIEGKPTQTEKKDIVEDKPQTNYDIERECKTFPVSEKVSQKTEEKSSWGNAPDFILSTTKGNTLTLSQFKGKVIILDFWATWCPLCKAEIPDFVELQNEYKDKGLLIIGVSLDNNPDAVNQFINEMQINYPIVMGNDKIVQDYGGIRGIPTTFVINKKGDIHTKFIGYRPKNIFEDEIKKLLKE